MLPRKISLKLITNSNADPYIRSALKKIYKN